MLHNSCKHSRVSLRMASLFGFERKGVMKVKHRRGFLCVDTIKLRQFLVVEYGTGYFQQSFMRNEVDLWTRSLAYFSRCFLFSPFLLSFFFSALSSQNVFEIKHENLPYVQIFEMLDIFLCNAIINWFLQALYL